MENRDHSKKFFRRFLIVVCAALILLLPCAWLVDACYSQAVKKRSWSSIGTFDEAWAQFQARNLGQRGVIIDKRANQRP
jgi:hypothetical protein